MKILVRFLAVVAVAITAATTAHAQTWLINLNNDTGYRGASQNGTDTNGNLWNNLDPWYWSAITTVSGTSSGGFRGNILSTTSGVDSYNGPLGADVSNPLTAIQVGNVTIDSAALGALGGSKAAAAGYATSTDMKFYLSVTNTNLTYDVSFYGAYRYATGNSTYTAYSDAAYTTVAQSTSLNVGGGGNYNGNQTATLTGLTAVTTPDASQGINLQLSGAGGVAGYLNSLELYGYIGYLNGSTATNADAPAAGYVPNGTYPNSDTRSVDTVIGGNSTLNINTANGIYYNSTLIMRAGGGTINAYGNDTVYAITGSGNLAVGGNSTLSFYHSGNYSGTVTVNSGLTLGTTNTLGTGNLVVNTGGSATLSSASALGTGSLTLNGGNVTLSVGNALGANSLTLNGGALKVGNATALGTGAITVVSGTTTLNNYNALTALTGNNPINLNGGGTFQVNGYGQNLNLGTGNVTVAGSNNLNAFSGGMRLDGVISGSGTLNWYGSGNLTLGAANTFTGTVAASGNNGTLALANVNALQHATLNMGPSQTLGFGILGNNTYNVGTLAGSNSTATIALGGNTINAGSNNGNSTYSGTLTGTGGGLTKSGSGALTLSGNNTYTGTTTISAGTLVLTAGGGIANSTVVNLGTTGSRGTLDLTAKSAYTFDVGVTVNGDGTINIGSGKTVTIAGNFQPGNSPGIVNVTGNLTLASTANITMELAGSSGVKGTDFDNSTSTGTTTYGGALSIVSFSGYDINAHYGVTYSLFDFAAYSGGFTSVAVAGTSLSQNGTLWTGTNLGTLYTFDLATGDLTVVPEPATWALLAFSLTTVTIIRRRRNS